MKVVPKTKKMTRPQLSSILWCERAATPHADVLCNPRHPSFASGNQTLGLIPSAVAHQLSWSWNTVDCPDQISTVSTESLDSIWHVDIYLHMNLFFLICELSTTPGKCCHSVKNSNFLSFSIHLIWLCVEENGGSDEQPPDSEPDFHHLFFVLYRAKLMISPELPLSLLWK